MSTFDHYSNVEIFGVQANYRLMNRFVVSACFLSALSTMTWAEGHNIDSLKNILKTTRDGATKISLNYEISDLYRIENGDSCLKYAQQGLLLAQVAKNDSTSISGLHRVGYAHMFKEDYGKAMNYFRSALSLMTKSKLPPKKALIYDDIARLYLNREMFDSSRHYSLEAYRIHLMNGDSAFLANTLGQLALISLTNGKLDSALSIALEAKHILESINEEDHDGLGVLYQNIAIIFSRMAELMHREVMASYADSATSYTFKAIEQYEYIGKIEGIAGCYNLLGNLQKDILDPEVTIDDLQMGIHYYEEALRLKYQLGKQHPIIISLMNLGQAIAELGEFTDDVVNKSAGLDSIQKSLILAKQHFPQNTVLQAEISINIGDVLRYSFEEPLAAKPYYLEAVRLASSNNQYKLLSSIYNHFAYLFVDINQYDSAFHYFVESTIIKDSIFNQEKELFIADLQEKYQLEARLNEIAKLRIENEYQKQKLNRNLILSSMAVMFASIGIIVGVFFFLVSRKSVAIKNKLETNIKDLRTIISRFRSFYDSILIFESSVRDSKALEIDQDTYMIYESFRNELESLFENIKKKATLITEYFSHRDTRSLKSALREITTGVLKVQASIDVLNAKLWNAKPVSRANYDELSMFVGQIDEKLNIQASIESIGMFKQRLWMVISIHFLCTVSIVLLSILFGWQRIELIAYIQNALFFALELMLIIKYEQQSEKISTS